jgi:hypothetical protein
MYLYTPSVSRVLFVILVTRELVGLVGNARYFCHSCLGFEVLATVYEEYGYFRTITPCNSERDLGFGGTYRLHPQGRNLNQARNQRKQTNLRSVLLCSLLDLEDRGNIFLRNVECRNYMTSQHRGIPCEQLR